MDQFEKGKPEPGSAKYEELMNKLAASQEKLESLKKEQNALEMLQRQASQNSSSNSMRIHNQMESLQRRLQALNHLYENQAAAEEEEEEEFEEENDEMTTQQLQTKLAQLHQEKEHMDKLLQEIAILKTKVQPSTPPVRERSNRKPIPVPTQQMNGYEAKVSELQQLTAKLASLQGFRNNESDGHRREHNDLRRRDETRHNDLRSKEERKRRSESEARRHEEEMSDAGSEYISKMNKMVEYRSKLAKMQDLLAVVERTQSAGLHMDSLPAYYQNMIHMFNEETRSESSSIDVDKEVKELPSKKGRQPKNARPQVNLWQEPQNKPEDGFTADEDAVLRQQLMLSELQKKKEELTSLLGSVKQQTNDLETLRQCALNPTIPLHNGYSSEDADVVEEPETGERDNHSGSSPAVRQNQIRSRGAVAEARAQSLDPRDLPRQSQEATNYEINENYGEKVCDDFMMNGLDMSGMAVQQSLMGLSHCYQMIYMQQREIQALKEQVHRLNVGQVENRETLNNQVMPGVRANNYWDNFRSYSCQNLLSKPRARTSSPVPALSSEPSTRASRAEASKTDNKQVNQTQRTNMDLGARPKESVNRRCPPPPRDQTRRGSGVREAVYAEVSQLIAANESRPQYLMELFRQLQGVNSDSLRDDVLLLIQRLQHKHAATTTTVTANVNEMQPQDCNKPCGVENLQLGAIPKTPVRDEATAREQDQRPPVVDDGEQGGADGSSSPQLTRSSHKPFSMFSSAAAQNLEHFSVPKVAVMPMQMKMEEEPEDMEIPDTYNLELAEADQSPGSVDQGDGIQAESHVRLPPLLNDSSWLEDGLPQNRHDQSGDVESGLDEVPTRLDGAPPGDGSDI